MIEATPDPRDLGCAWCEDYADGLDPEPCAVHSPEKE